MLFSAVFSRNLSEFLRWRIIIIVNSWLLYSQRFGNSVFSWRLSECFRCRIINYWLIYSQCSGRYTLQPSSGVCRNFGHGVLSRFRGQGGFSSWKTSLAIGTGRDGFSQVCLPKTRYVWMNNSPAFKPRYAEGIGQVLTCVATAPDSRDWWRLPLGCHITTFRPVFFRRPSYSASSYTCFCFTRDYCAHLCCCYHTTFSKCLSIQVTFRVSQTEHFTQSTGAKPGQKRRGLVREFGNTTIVCSISGEASIYLGSVDARRAVLNTNKTWYTRQRNENTLTSYIK